MFDLPTLQLSVKARHGLGQWVGEGVATFGLILTIIGTARSRPSGPRNGRALYRGRVLVHLVDHFANPAITIARSLSDTFAGIAPSEVPPFVMAQLLGAALAWLVGGWLFGASEAAPAAT